MREPAEESDPLELLFGDREGQVGDVMVRDSLGHSHQKIKFIHGDGRGSANLCLDTHGVDIALDTHGVDIALDTHRVDIALVRSLVECLGTKS